MKIHRAFVALSLGVIFVACRDSASTAPSNGQLAVSAAGLPAGAKPAILVTGPASFSQLVDTTRTLTGLPVGSFTLTASDVTSGSVRYAATPATQTVTVRSDALTTASQILYGIASGKLAVTVIGLPTGAAGSVTITGPRAYSRTITETTQLDLLEPGTYTVVATNVVASGKVYRPATATVTVGVTASLTPIAALIDYGLGSSTLRVSVNGLPFDVLASVDVTGPSGFARHLTESTTLGRLEAGSYTVTANIVGSVLTTNTPAIAVQTVALSGTDSLNVAVNYASNPLQLSLKLFAEGLVQPVFLAAPDGDARQFIVERGGRVKLVLNGVLQATPFLDITSRVNNVGERGMLSMAFDPAYASNGFVYVFYVGLNGNVIVERIASTPGSNVAGNSAGIVISIPHGGSEHHGGTIAFGADGMLYLAPGDGGCCGDPRANAQNLGTLLGKVLRIDARSLPYKIPADNPFIAQSGALPEIWAFGLRNPWRFSFDAPTGSLYIGDVGQDAYEEVDAVQANAGGLNYGWPFTEGTACYNPSTNCAIGRTFTFPVLDYPHSDGCSVIGGYVYRGSAIPELVGHYLYADFCKGWLRSFRLINGVANERRNWGGVTLLQTSSFGRDGAGEVYMISGTRVWKIVRQGS